MSEFERRIGEVIDAGGLRVSETILADSLRLEPFRGRWVAKFEGAVWLTPEQFAKLNMSATSVGTNPESTD